VVLNNSSKNSKAVPSLSYTLCQEAKDANIIEAMFQIDEHFSPAMPENCYDGKAFKLSSS
jgi:hypothetical protein